MTKHISCDCECKFNSVACNLNQKWNNKTCQCQYENYRKCKKDCSWNLGTYISEDSKYSKSIAHTSVITCEEIISFIDIVSTKMTNTIALNVSTNCYTEKVKYKIDCYILHCFISEMFY